tara:strand:+ start:2586 stop:2828 length:243 start_codon:yes stop_codon:yes gene_type:complete
MKEQLNNMKTNHAVFWFENLWGASVVKNEPMAYCKDGFPYEIAVLNKRGQIDYTTPLTNDVLGYLTTEQAVTTLEAIKEL